MAGQYPVTSRLLAAGKCRSAIMAPCRVSATGNRLSPVKYFALVSIARQRRQDVRLPFESKTRCVTVV
jgi:hypothetical protein